MLTFCRQMFSLVRDISYLRRNKYSYVCTFRPAIMRRKVLVNNMLIGGERSEVEKGWRKAVALQLAYLSCVDAGGKKLLYDCSYNTSIQ